MSERITKFRQDLHQIPELELSCPKTKAYIVQALSPLSCTLSYPMESAVLAYFDNNKEETIAFRSDMDALPVTENTGLSFASKHPGHMHACGHDGHMAMLLELAYRINAFYQDLPFNILLIFQPGEETPGGARLLVEKGILETYRVKEIYGTHLWPFEPAGKVLTRSGSMMARSSEVNITVHGKSSHAAKYKEGVDAVEIASRYLIDLYTMESRIDPSVQRLLRFGRIDGGTVRNVVADTCILEGTMRALDDAVYDYLKQQLFVCAEKYPEAKFTMDINEGYPIVYNDPNLTEQVLSMEHVKPLKETQMISEDFSWYQQRVPGVFFFLGTGTGIPLHNDKFNFDEAILEKGVENYIRILQKRASR